MTPVRVGICILVAFTVLAHGAVEAWSKLSSWRLAQVLLFLLLWGVLASRLERVEIHWNSLYFAFCWRWEGSRCLNFWPDSRSTLMPRRLNC